MLRWDVPTAQEGDDQLSRTITGFTSNKKKAQGQVETNATHLPASRSKTVEASYSCK